MAPKQPNSFLVKLYMRDIVGSRNGELLEVTLWYFSIPCHIKPCVLFSSTRLSSHLLPKAFADSPAWPSGIVSSEDSEIYGVGSISAISFPSLLQRHDEGIAPSLSQSSVVFEMLTVL